MTKKLANEQARTHRTFLGMILIDFSDQAPCDFSFVDAGDKGLTIDFVGPSYDSIVLPRS